MANTDDLAEGNGRFNVDVAPLAVDGTVEHVEGVRSWKLCYNGTLVLRTEDQVFIRVDGTFSGADISKAK